MKLAGTGHRPNKLNNEYNMRRSEYGPLTKKINTEVELVLSQLKPEVVISGVALGFDMILANAALFMGIPLICAVPFVGQDRLWPPKSRDYYNCILNKAHDVVVVCEGDYAKWKLHKRNEWMVDQLDSPEDRLLSCWDGTEGGTASCRRYAEGKVEIINIDIKGLI